MNFSISPNFHDNIEPLDAEEFIKNNLDPSVPMDVEFLRVLLLARICDRLDKLGVIIEAVTEKIG
jgi:hypothetical protein